MIFTILMKYHTLFFFRKFRKKLKKLSSAAVVIGALRVNGGSYMSAHVLLKLLNKLKKSDKMLGLTSILLLFCIKFNKLNRTVVWML